MSVSKRLSTDKKVSLFKIKVLDTLSPSGMQETYATIWPEWSAILARWECVLYPLAISIMLTITALVMLYASTHILAHPANNITGLPSWDANYFIHTAAAGAYRRLSATPFFPLLPILMAGLHAITHWPYAWCGFIVTNVVYCLALITFYQLALIYLDRTRAQYALWLLVMFPTAMFFNEVYSESLTLFTTVLFFYCLEKRYWYIAMAIGFFSATAHTLNVLLVVAGLYHLWQQRHTLSSSSFWVRFFSLGIIASGLLCYMGYLQWHFGNPFAFLEAEQYWKRTAVIPTINMLNNLVDFFSFQIKDTPNGILMRLVNSVCGLWMVILAMSLLISSSAKKAISTEMKLFFFITLLFSISSGTKHGTVEAYGRFMAVLFPGFMIWAAHFKRNILFVLTLATMIPIKTLLQLMYSGGYWVT